MTASPMSAEARAEALFEAIIEADHSVYLGPAVEALITDAIRQAENDKLEEAAACASEMVLRAIDDGSPGAQVAAAAAFAVRSLKSED